MTINGHFNGRQVLVTGSTGFVGGHLATRLLREGAKVRLLVRETSNASRIDEFRSLGAEIVVGDIRDEERVISACKDCVYVFHIGAIFREAKFPDEVYFQINATGTKHILLGAERHRVTRVVHCSTNGVHGGIGREPVKETAPFHPTDVYQESKLEAENYVRDFVSSGRVDAAIIRPAMIWGEGDMRFRKMFRGVARRSLPIIGTGKTWTHWIYVHDLVSSFLLAALSPQAKGEAYLIAGRRPVPLDEVYAGIARLAGVNVLPFRIPALPLQLAGSGLELLCRPLGVEPPLHRRRVDFFVKNRIFDISKARSQLGYEPAQNFEDELKNVYNWYQTSGLL